jgi:hypothetical protein
MAATVTLANRLFLSLAQAAIDFENDTFMIALMDTGFTFDPDTDHGWADVSGDELANGNGYTTGGQALANVTVNENDVTDRTEVAWDNAVWTAASGAIGPAAGAIIFDTTATADPIIAYIDFGGDLTAADTIDFNITGLQVNIGNLA